MANRSGGAALLLATMTALSASGAAAQDRSEPRAYRVERTPGGEVVVSDPYGRVEKRLDRRSTGEWVGRDRYGQPDGTVFRPVGPSPRDDVPQTRRAPPPGFAR